MAASDDLGRWAAAFLQHYAQEDSAAASMGASAERAASYSGITQDAVVLLESVDRGGVPAFITQHLLKIARDNGVAVANETTPNDIIAALREMAACAADPGGAQPKAP